MIPGGGLCGGCDVTSGCSSFCGVCDVSSGCGSFSGGCDVTSGCSARILVVVPRIGLRSTGNRRGWRWRWDDVFTESAVVIGLTLTREAVDVVATRALVLTRVTVTLVRL